MSGATTTAPHRLKRLRLSEISLVDRPANKSARIAIAKQDGEITHLQDCDDGSALVMFPVAGNVAKGARIATARPLSDAHATTGEVLEVTDAGQAIARISPSLNVLAKRADALAKKLAPTGTPNSSKEPRMSDQERLEKAAQRGMADWADRSEWATAMRKRADQHRRDGETVEMAQRRLFKSDQTMQQMRQCYETARPAPAPAPDPTTKAQRNGAEARLEALAEDYAKTRGVSMVEARAAVAKSPEGQRIRAEAQG